MLTPHTSLDGSPPDQAYCNQPMPEVAAARPRRKSTWKTPGPCSGNPNRLRRRGGPSLTKCRLADGAERMSHRRSAASMGSLPTAPRWLHGQPERAPQIDESRTCLREDLPVDQGGELHQFVAHVDYLDQACAQQIILFRGQFSGVHITAENHRVPAATISNAASKTQEKPDIIYQ